MYKVRIRTHGRIRKIEKSCGLRVAFLMGATTYQKAQPLQSLQSVIFATFSKAQPATAQPATLHEKRNPQPRNSHRLKTIFVFN